MLGGAGCSWIGRRTFKSLYQSGTSKLPVENILNVPNPEKPPRFEVMVMSIHFDLFIIFSMH